MKPVKPYLSLLICLPLLVLTLSNCKKKKKDTETVTPAKETIIPVGNLSYSGTTSTFTYRSKGGGKVTINTGTYITFTHDSFPGFELLFWGGIKVNGVTKNTGYYENVKGKHVKNRETTRRTVIFPDGTKITFATDSLKGPIVSVSIIDGSEGHHIDHLNNLLDLSSTDAAVAKKLDDDEPDGETAAIELTATGLLYVNIYREDVAGNKVNKRVPIAETFFTQPNRVEDYYP